MNNKINIENYEAFLLDWMERNLSREDVLLLKEFLKKHPEVKVENDLSAQTLDATNVDFLEKNSLKKSLTDDDYIAYHEGDLSLSKKQEIEEYITTDTNAKKDFELYGKLKLQAPAIIFEDKTMLKKKGVEFTFKRVVYYASATAAIFVLAFLLFKDTTSIYTPKDLTVRNNVNNKSTTVQEEPLDFLVPKEKIIVKPMLKKSTLIAENNLNENIKKEKKNQEETANKSVYDVEMSTELTETDNRINKYFDYMYAQQNIEDESYIAENNSSKKLTVKEFLVSKIKKHILKVNDEKPNKLEVDDFAKTVANISNNKIVLQKKGEADHLHVQTKLFSLDKKISN